MPPEAVWAYTAYEVVGTIAGDDTMLVIASDREAAEVIQEKLMAILEAS